VRTTEARANARDLLRTFVESHPQVNQALITRRNGGRLVVAWPWRPVLRTAIRAAITPDDVPTGRTPGPACSSDRKVIPIRGGSLLVVPLGRRLEFRLALSNGYEFTGLWPHVTSLVSSIERIQNLIC
jgi:hypothetical protein